MGDSSQKVSNDLYINYNRDTGYELEGSYWVMMYIISDRSINIFVDRPRGISRTVNTSTETMQPIIGFYINYHF